MIIRINHSWLLSHQCHLIVVSGIAYNSTLCISNYRAHQLRESRIVIWFSKKHLLHNTKQYPGVDDDDTSLKKMTFLADGTNGRAYATVFRLFVYRRLWRYVLWLNGAFCV